MVGLEGAVESLSDAPPPPFPALPKWPCGTVPTSDVPDPPSPSKTVNGGYGGYCMRCCIGKPHGWWWCLAQSMFVKLSRSGPRAGGGLDGARPQGRWGIGMCGTRSSGHKKKRVNRCSYSGYPRAWMSRAVSMQMTSRSRAGDSIRIVCCRCQGGGG